MPVERVRVLTTRMQHGGGVLCLTARPWAELSAIKLPARAPEAPVQAQPPAVDPRDGTNLVCLLSSALHADASVATEAGARVPGHRVMLASREGVSENTAPLPPPASPAQAAPSP